MANRPRRLDEIDKAFGESLKAKEAIKAGGASVSEESSRPEAVQTPEIAAPVKDGFKPISPQGAVEDISAVADEFIMRFGTPERAAATTRLRENETMRAKVIPTKPVTRSTGATAPKASPAAKAEKADTPSPKAEAPSAPPISRVTPLMDEYQRVMNDEDDDTSLSDLRRSKKSSRIKTKKKTSPVVKKSAPAEPAPEETDDSFDVPVVSFEVPEEFRGIEEVASGDTAETVTDEIPVVKYESAESGYSLSNDTLSDEADDVSDDVSESDDYEDILSRYDDAEEVVEVDDDYEDEEHYVKTGSSGKGHKLLRALLSLAMVFTMLTACGIGAAKLLLGVNTGKIIGEKYSIFTCDENYPFLELNSGDLVVTENIYPLENKNVVYYDNEIRSFVFAKYITAQEIGRETYHRLKTGEYDENVSVTVDQIKGVFKTTIPSVGDFVSVITDYYVIIIALLVCIAVLLLLIVIFGFSSGDKSKAYTNEYEDDDEEDDEDDDFSLSE